MHTTAATTFGLLFLLIVQSWVRSYIKSKKYRLPPAVPGMPIFGNALQIPALQQGPWAKKLAEQYGEMFTLKFGAQTWVFLNSSRTVNDLLERRAAIYASRPPFPMTQGIMSGNSRIVLMPYNEQWRTLRKVMHQILTVAKLYMPFEDLESKQLLWDYLEKPDRWWSANGRYANSVIMSVIFGRRSQLDDPDVVELFETLELFLENQQPGVNIVDAFPVLDRLPKQLQWWRPRGERIFEKTRKVYLREEERLKRKMKEGTQKECFGTAFLDTKEVSQMTETQRLFVFGTLMEAGSDTSRVTLGQIIAGAATYPNWVERARAELDAVSGHNAERLPQWEDRERLPYITAVVKEGFRWRPNIAEIGAPTMLTKDDEYEGYKFPAGTVFTWNAWAIALDPREYKDPERFWPDRFLDFSQCGVLNLWAIVSSFRSFLFNVDPIFGSHAQFETLRNAIINWRAVWHLRFESGFSDCYGTHDPWAPQCMTEPDSPWKRIGFYRNAPEYWLLARVMLDKVEFSRVSTEGGESLLGRENCRETEIPLILSKFDETSMDQVNDLITSFQPLRMNE